MTSEGAVPSQGLSESQAMVRPWTRVSHYVSSLDRRPGIPSASSVAVSFSNSLPQLLVSSVQCHLDQASYLLRPLCIFISTFLLRETHPFTQQSPPLGRNSKDHRD